MIMKNKWLLNYSVLLAIAITQSLTNTSPVSATPDPIFNPVMHDLQRMLPTGWVMRLPSKIKISDYKGGFVRVFPTVGMLKNRKFFIGFKYKPNCEALACGAGMYIEAYRVGASDLTENKPLGNIITLKPGIQATYHGNCFDPYNSRVGSRGRIHSVRWKQDNMIFSLFKGCPSSDIKVSKFEKRVLIEMAISMTNEPPIKSR
jgi:hypothetical protein